MHYISSAGNPGLWVDNVIENAPVWLFNSVSQIPALRALSGGSWGLQTSPLWLKQQGMSQITKTASWICSDESKLKSPFLAWHIRPNLKKSAFEVSPTYNFAWKNNDHASCAPATFGRENNNFSRCCICISLKQPRQNACVVIIEGRKMSNI